jgi:hypothetical protein
MKSTSENALLTDVQTNGPIGAATSAASAESLDVITAVSVPGLLVGLALLEIPAEPHLILCGFRLLTGLPCPGCGITRGLSALLHGRLIQALEFNPFAMVVLLVLALLWLRSVCLLMNQRAAAASIKRLLFCCRHRVLTWGWLLAVGGFWAFRLWACLTADGFQVAVRGGWLFRLFHQASM